MPEPDYQTRVHAEPETASAERGPQSSLDPFEALAAAQAQADEWRRASMTDDERIDAFGSEVVHLARGRLAENAAYLGGPVRNRYRGGSAPAHLETLRAITAEYDALLTQGAGLYHQLEQNALHWHALLTEPPHGDGTLDRKYVSQLAWHRDHRDVLTDELLTHTVQVDALLAGHPEAWLLVSRQDEAGSAFVGAAPDESTYVDQLAHLDDETAARLIHQRLDEVLLAIQDADERIASGDIDPLDLGRAVDDALGQTDAYTASVVQRVRDERAASRNRTALVIAGIDVALFVGGLVAGGPIGVALEAGAVGLAGTAAAVSLEDALDQFALARTHLDPNQALAAGGENDALFWGALEMALTTLDAFGLFRAMGTLDAVRKARAARRVTDAGHAAGELAAVEVRLGDELHHLRAFKLHDGRAQIVLCSTCGPLLDKVDTALAGDMPDGLRARLTALRAETVALESRLADLSPEQARDQLNSLVARVQAVQVGSPGCGALCGLADLRVAFRTPTSDAVSAFSRRYPAGDAKTLEAWLTNMESLGGQAHRGARVDLAGLDPPGVLADVAAHPNISGLDEWLDSARGDLLGPLEPMQSYDYLNELREARKAAERGPVQVGEFELPRTTDGGAPGPSADLVDGGGRFVEVKTVRRPISGPAGIRSQLNKAGQKLVDLAPGAQCDVVLYARLGPKLSQPKRIGDRVRRVLPDGRQVSRPAAGGPEVADGHFAEQVVRDLNRGRLSSGTERIERLTIRLDEGSLTVRQHNGQWSVEGHD